MSFYERLWYSPQFFYRLALEQFIPDKVNFEKKHYPRQDNKVWIVSGSTAGIGFLVAQELAELGATVWLVGRSEQKAKDCVAAIKDAVKGAKVDYLLVDFADLSTIKPGVAKFLATNSDLHGIVHNAGVMQTPADKRTKQGWEMQLGVNGIATWLFQKFLDAPLLKTNNGRIVWVSSLAHWGAPFSGAQIAKDPSYCPAHGEAYLISKAVNIIEAGQWTQLHPEANVKSVSVHPGVIRSQLTREMSGVGQAVIHKLSWPTEYGAYSELGAALANVPQNAHVVPFGKVGPVRKDIHAAGQQSLDLAKWLDAQVKDFL